MNRLATHRLATSGLCAAVLLCAGPVGTAFAQQSYNPPAGREAATTPGGTEGIAGPRNEAEAIRSGDAVAVTPGADGLAVERPVAPMPGEPLVAPPGVRP